LEHLLKAAAESVTTYLEGLRTRRVAPDPAAVLALSTFDHALPSEPRAPEAILRLLEDRASPATVASASGRFFGFVVGGSLPAALAANWLAGAWDQDAGLFALSPATAVLEEVALAWLADLFGLPKGTAGGFVTGATMANFTGLAAARQALLAKEGWDVCEQGLFGAPPIEIVVSEEVHTSVLKALSLLGLGRGRVRRLETDAQGRILKTALPHLGPRTILCLQAGNVNTGSFDPAAELVGRAQADGAWVHVDGAFGLWASVSSQKRHLVQGFSAADSFATDCHKWLNVPYDSGVALVKNGAALEAAMSSIGAVYLQRSGRREPSDYTPELSRRSRGVEVWAALLSLGRAGLEELVERCCAHAVRFSEGLRAQGWTVVNDVVLNQVLVARQTDEETKAVTAAVQSEGTCFCSGTTFKGRAAMRLSVSSWATTEDDVRVSLEAIGRCVRDPSLGRHDPSLQTPVK
jgi:glutamate/tyrosine decarboxylase-like PLP-dependent enzyme